MLADYKCSNCGHHLYSHSPEPALRTAFYDGLSAAGSCSFKKCVCKAFDCEAGARRRETPRRTT